MQITRRTLLAAGAGFLAAGPALAQPQKYALDSDASTVGFMFNLAGNDQRGSMPVKAADVIVDPDNLRASRVDVTLDVGNAQTNLFLATQAMIGPKVLDAARYPTIRFRSRSVRLGAGGRISEGASLSGDLTIRDITRTIALDAQLYRAKGSAPDDLSELSIRLRGQLSRSAFGATGFPDLVHDNVTLDIRTVIRQA